MAPALHREVERVARRANRASPSAVRYVCDDERRPAPVALAALAATIATPLGRHERSWPAQRGASGSNEPSGTRWGPGRLRFSERCIAQLQSRRELGFTDFIGGRRRRPAVRDRHAVEARFAAEVKTALRRIVAVRALVRRAVPARGLL